MSGQLMDGARLVCPICHATNIVAWKGQLVLRCTACNAAIAMDRVVTPQELREGISEVKEL